jgi:tetratricopeptide (TPR) repeat protein
MKHRYIIILFVLLALDFACAAPAHAAAQVDKEQALILEAAARSMKRDFRGAEAIYTRIINTNNESIEGYLQRGLVRRSLANPQGVVEDATRARAFIDAALPQNTNNANLYYQRSLADRMLKDFDAAEQDLHQAIRLGKRDNFDNDFKAIEVERKMAQ